MAGLVAGVCCALTDSASGQAPPAARLGAGQQQSAAVRPLAAPRPADSTKVYTYVKQMPQLLGYGGSSAAIAAAIRDKLALTPQTAACAGSRVFVTFIVDAVGTATAPHVVKGVGNGCDEATLTAVRRLPRFTPGRQNGRPVAVSYTVLVSRRAPAKKP